MLVKSWPRGDWRYVGIGSALHNGIREFVITTGDTQSINDNPEEFISWLKESILPRLMLPDADFEEFIPRENCGD